jgi:thioredoxin-dependent peroxiredoxin
MATHKTAATKKSAKTTKDVKATRAANAAPKRTSKPAPGDPTRRVGLMELGGKPATIVGDDLQVGRKAPAFSAQVGVWPGYDMWTDLEPLAATAGKVRILAAVPSLDTATCDVETKRFNAEAANLGQGIVIITISADLPPTQRRWCGTANVDKVVTVSDHMTTDFGIKYGVLMAERRWLRRAVFVVGPDDVLRYVAYMPKLSDQPDYEAVLAAARAALPA